MKLYVILRGPLRRILQLHSSEVMSFKMLAHAFSPYLQVSGSFQLGSQSESAIRLTFQPPVGQGDEFVIVQLHGLDPLPGLPDSGWEERRE